LFGKRERNADSERREALFTIATCLTALRALGAGTLFVTALVNDSSELLLIALGVSMFFDFVDGFVARSSDAETVFGAQLDGLADRMAAAFVIAGACSMRGDTATWIAAGLVWLQFGVLDHLLSSQFLRFGLWSPDHFYVIDQRVWRMNWSSLAKLASNLPVALLALGATTSWIAAGLALSLIVVRIPSYHAVSRQAVRLDEFYLAASACVLEREAPGVGRPTGREQGLAVPRTDPVRLRRGYIPRNAVRRDRRPRAERRR